MQQVRIRILCDGRNGSVSNIRGHAQQALEQKLEEAERRCEELRAVGQAPLHVPAG